jgi:hypothetical protein
MKPQAWKAAVYLPVTIGAVALALTLAYLLARLPAGLCAEGRVAG